MKHFYFFLRTGLTYLIVFCFSLISFAQVPNLGTAANYALFTTTGAVSSTSISHIIGKIGSNDGAITNFTPIVGQQENANIVTLQASIDLALAYASILARPVTFPSHGTIFGNGEILTAGVYNLGAATSFENILYLDAEGDPNAIFIFRILGALTSAAGSKISLLGGASPYNIFWTTQGGAISLATNSEMKGNFIANPGAVSTGDGCLIEGRLLSTTGAISVYGTDVTAIPFNLLSSTLKDFHANSIEDAIDITWASLNEFSLAGYELERSGDGRVFSSLAHITPTSHATLNSYHWRDNNPFHGINFYRLKITSRDGDQKYSIVVSLDKSGKQGMNVFPNPVAGHILNLQMADQLKGNYEISIYNGKTDKLMTTHLSHNGSNATYNIPIQKNAKPGMYYMEVSDQKKNKKIFKILVE